MRSKWSISFLLILALALLGINQMLVAQDTSSDCPLGQGYWKNTPAAWPVTELTIGGQVYTQGELLALLFTPPQGDASLILAHQLIAARLNMANGADSSAISAVLIEVDALLATYTGKLPLAIAPASPEGQTMVIAGSTFDAYNSGFLSVDCAPEATEGPEATATPEMTPDPETTPDPDDNNDLVIKIVIEGPVESININIITIYGINIQVDVNDPILTIIQIGDIIRVAGDLVDSNGGTIIIIAINIVIINVDINIDNGEVWRDSGDCGNPPPPWAPAVGWRRKCESGGGNNNAVPPGQAKKSNKNKSNKGKNK